MQSKRFLESVKKFAGRVTEAERLLVVVCAQEADSDDVQKAGYGLKGDFLIGYDENGEPPFCSQPSHLKATADLKGEAVTLLTASYFAGAWTRNTHLLLGPARKSLWLSPLLAAEELEVGFSWLL